LSEKVNKISLKEKINKLSTKKMLNSLNSISKERMDKIKEQNPIPFMMAVFIGFIKDNDKGYEFTEKGIKSFKSIIKSSMNIIENHCPKEEYCKKSNSKSKKQKEVIKMVKGEKKDKQKHNISQKATEELSYEDALELKEILTSLEFVHMASIHACVRENKESYIKGGGKNKKNKKNNIKKTISYLKQEDIKWLKEKHPEKFECAKKLGFVNDEFEMTDITTKIIEDSNNINGISIDKAFEQNIVSQ